MNAAQWFYSQSFCGPVSYLCTARGIHGSVQTYTVSVPTWEQAEAFRKEHEGRGETVEIRGMR